MSPTDGGAANPNSLRTADGSTEELFRQLDLNGDEQQRQVLCDQIIAATIPMADRLAGRYRNRGVPIDDLRQVARTALVQAIRRFDGAEQRSFLAYAIPCIRGELKRYFRDHGWMVRPPRRIQEAHLALGDAGAELTQLLGREPTVEELADLTGVSPETVGDARGVGHCYQPDSLDRPFAGSDTDLTLGDSVGETEEGFNQVEAQALIRPLLATLVPRDRQLVMLRFFVGLTQSEVGQRIGISQMQVSRIESRILRTFRETLTAA
jgi:RNA polymerase sigma-B factor